MMLQAWLGISLSQLLCLIISVTPILPSYQKKLIPIVPTDYRPISLCNVVYKIISKCLANRLKPHLPDYIHPAQQAFIEGRRICDNIIIAQEITHSFNLSNWNSKAFMLKIDLAKAF